MGSIQHDGGGDLWPATKLPLFNTTTQASDLFSYHEVTAKDVPLVIGSEHIYKRFARFVAAVVGSGENIAFLAETKSELALAIYNAIPQDGVQLKEISREDADLGMNGLDFGIRICHQPPAGAEMTEGSRPTKTLQPFVLEIVLGSQKGVADITLRLRADHGPRAAAQHLINLAIAHIGPKDELANVESSHIRGPAILPPGSENRDEKNIMLHSVLERAARSNPTGIAIDEVTGRSGLGYSRRSVTYCELDAQAGNWAKEITFSSENLGWPVFRGEQRIIPIYLPNCTELSICMNGILRAGHCFCSLPMDAPVERLRNFLNDLGAPGMVGIGANPWAGTPFGEEIIWIDFLNPTACLTGTVHGTLQQLPAETLRTAREDDVAYIIYTSGSTGRPKGVVLNHCTAMAFLTALDRQPGSLPSGPNLRWMNMSAPTFDMMLMDHFMPLLKGGTVTIAERGLLLSNPEAVITELGATATLMVPSLAMLLRPERMPTLDLLYVGGELVAQRVLDKFTSRSGESKSNRRLLGAYGPTETSVMASIWAYDSKSRPSVIGAPLPGLQYVIIEMGVGSTVLPQVAPFGVAGELAIGGPQLSPGYLNRPTETDRAFIDVPLYGRLYRTGDKARVVWSEQGEPVIDFLGRVNIEQVKLNGRRVELPEIENVLFKVRDVAHAAVFASESRVVACIMPREGSSHENAALEAQCRSEAARYLPAWMQPVQYIFNKDLPRTTSGKVDRRALQSILCKIEAAPTDSKPLDSPAVRQPDYKSIVYHCLASALGARIWEQEISASLVSLGLDSLRALVLIQELEDLGVDQLDIQVVLMSATIHELIAAVESHQAEQRLVSQAVNGVQEVNKLENDRGYVAEMPVKHPVASDTSAVGHSDARSGDHVNVSTMGASSDDIFDLPLEGKLRHFEYHCRPICLTSLHLSDDQIEQVLPVTNVQARFVAAAVDPTIFDPKRYTGRPNVTHLPYLVPEDMDPARLQRAVEAVLPRYDCFRTVFVPVSHPLAPFAQCILAQSLAVIPKVEVVCNHRISDTDENTSLWQQTINGVQRAAEAAMSIDRPGIAVSWVWSRNKARCVFVMSLFHGIYDGTQLVYLRDAIASEYAYPGSDAPMQLLPMYTAVKLGLSYDWVGTVMYWARRLGGIPHFHTGPRQPVPSITLPVSISGNEETHMRTLSVRSVMTMRELDQAAVGMSTTMLTVVEAAWASVLVQTLPRDIVDKGLFNIQFGTVMNGRRHHEALRCMAPMIAALPVLLEFGDTSTPTMRTNRETCALLAAQRIEAEEYLQMPCPTTAHAKMGTDRIDTVLLLQALQHDGPGSQDRFRELPKYNMEENLLPAWKEGDSGWPILTEVWPGRLCWSERMQLRCTYNTRRPGYEFLARDWIIAALSALDEAIVRITGKPDELFYVG